MDDKAAREKRLQFLMLCGPLEDAIDLIDAGKVESARALLKCGRNFLKTKLTMCESMAAYSS